jgi:uncharacterized membrane-anchored protein
MGQAASGMYQLRSRRMMYVVKWVLCLTVAMTGIIIMIADPTHHKLGVLLSFGGFILFGLSVAQAHINTLE